MENAAQTTDAVAQLRGRFSLMKSGLKCLCHNGSRVTPVTLRNTAMMKLRINDLCQEVMYSGGLVETVVFLVLFWVFSFSLHPKPCQSFYEKSYVQIA